MFTGDHVPAGMETGGGLFCSSGTGLEHCNSDYGVLTSRPAYARTTLYTASLPGMLQACLFLLGHGSPGYVGSPNFHVIKGPRRFRAEALAEAQKLILMSDKGTLALRLKSG